MTNFEEYTAYLEEQSHFFIICCVIFLILFIILAILIFTGKIRGSEDNKDKILSILVSFCFFSVLWGILGNNIYKIEYDIRNQAYHIYEGEFIYEHSYHGTKGGHQYSIIIFDDGKEKELCTEYIEIDYGTHSGKLVYSEKSEYLLEYDINELRGS